MADIASIHNDPTNPTPALGYGRMLTGVDEDFATALLAAVGPGVQVPLIAVELRHLGSRAAEDVDGGSAVGGRAPKFTLNLLGVPDRALFETVLPNTMMAVAARLLPWFADETNVNFAPSFRPDEPPVSAWSPQLLRRLAAVRAEYDPRGTFAYGADEHSRD